LPKEIGERVKALARACLFRSGHQWCEDDPVFGMDRIDRAQVSGDV
jgi:hypothetical protein